MHACMHDKQPCMWWYNYMEGGLWEGEKDIEGEFKACLREGGRDEGEGREGGACAHCCIHVLFSKCTLYILHELILN